MTAHDSQHFDSLIRLEVLVLLVFNPHNSSLSERCPIIPERVLLLNKLLSF